MKVRQYVNRHGMQVRVVHHDNNDVVCMAQYRGEFARWDAHEKVGYWRWDGAMGRIMDREDWNVAVKVRASMIGSE